MIEIIIVLAAAGCCLESFAMALVAFTFSTEVLVTLAA
jgi:hypothetical protein